MNTINILLEQSFYEMQSLDSSNAPRCSIFLPLAPAVYLKVLLHTHHSLAQTKTMCSQANPLAEVLKVRYLTTNDARQRLLWAFDGVYGRKTHHRRRFHGTGMNALPAIDLFRSESRGTVLGPIKEVCAEVIKLYAADRSGLGSSGCVKGG